MSNTNKEMKDFAINIFNDMSPLKVNNEYVPGYTINKKGIVLPLLYNSSVIIKNNRRYINIHINSDETLFCRIDYLVAHNFMHRPTDAIRLIHMDNDTMNDNLENLRWLSINDILDHYYKYGIISDRNIDNIPEIWKDCILDHDCNRPYEVSNYGNIRDKNTKQLISSKDSFEYKVFYYIDKHTSDTRIQSIHRAVAKAFIPNINDYSIINHLDGDYSNNKVWNLEWATDSMNQEQAYCTSQNVNDRYTDEEIHQCCKLLEEGVQQVKISEITGVDRKAVNNLYRGKRWKHISSQYKFPEKRWDSSLPAKIIELYKQYPKGVKGTGKIIRKKLNMGDDQAAISYYERVVRKYNKVD